MPRPWSLQNPSFSALNRAVSAPKWAINGHPRLKLAPNFTRVSLGPPARSDGLPKSCPSLGAFKIHRFRPEIWPFRLQIGFKSPSKALIGLKMKLGFSGPFSQMYWSTKKLPYPWNLQNPWFLARKRPEISPKGDLINFKPPSTP